MPWPLLERYPELAMLNPSALCTLPTPVDPLPGLGANCWVKRDDISARPYGGNKLRKLEWILPDIRREDAHTVVTLGATGTNAGLATSLLCQKEGLQCDIFTFPQPDSPVVRQNRLAMQQAGAKLHDRGSLLGAALGWYLHPGRLKHGYYFLYAGCSNPVATLGYVNAILELKQQIDEGLCPAPAALVVAAGSCATAAGLLVGSQISGLNTRIHAVQVAQDKLGPFSVCNARLTLSMARAAWQQLDEPGELDPRLLHWHDNYLGQGYGQASELTRQAKTLAAREGLLVEDTYSGKAFAAFSAISQQQPGPTLFWHTFNAHPL
ncbi:MAG: hypothetical protein CL537_12925 [Alcanivoracaceae bacterium]|nr:hypothetical protein [Alcanivoracaceae bacterium]|tara:strand:- start:532 stop:1497 length:966 start_codon:yes stop_codon:yes gene_type:complete